MERRFGCLPPFLLLFALAVAVVGLGRGARAGVALKPNLVFILCDDLGYGDLGCYGSKTIKTPNLDRLAEQGLRLTACYSGSPVCSPSRAALLTGRNPNRMGIRDWIPPDSGIYLPRQEVTVASLLKRAGYRTALVGKWHLNSRMDGSEPTPKDHGFDHWFATQNNAAPSHQDPVNFVRNGQPVGPLKGNSSTLTVDEALAFLDKEKGSPFALFVWFHAPHEPVAVPEDYRREQYPDVSDETRADYYASVTLMDREVGRLLQRLDELNLSERTWVQFTSDNGPETLNRYKTATRSHGSPGPLRGMKLHVTEAGYRVPGIIRWPRLIKGGQVSDEPVSGVDVLPTFCELAGIDAPEDRPLDGTSILPLLQGRPIRRAVPLYWQYDRAISRPWTLSLRDGDWKLLADAGLQQFELYNLKDDPSEQKDRAAEQPERVQLLAAAMKRLYGEINGGGR